MPKQVRQAIFFAVLTTTFLIISFLAGLQATAAFEPLWRWFGAVSVASLISGVVTCWMALASIEEILGLD